MKIREALQLGGSKPKPEGQRNLGLAVQQESQERYTYLDRMAHSLGFDSAASLQLLGGKIKAIPGRSTTDTAPLGFVQGNMSQMQDSFLREGGVYVAPVTFKRDDQGHVYLETIAMKGKNSRILRPQGLSSIAEEDIMEAYAGHPVAVVVQVDTVNAPGDLSVSLDYQMFVAPSILSMDLIDDAPRLKDLPYGAYVGISGVVDKTKVEKAHASARRNETLKRRTIDYAKAIATVSPLERSDINIPEMATNAVGDDKAWISDGNSVIAITGDTTIVGADFATKRTNIRTGDAVRAVGIIGDGEVSIHGGYHLDEPKNRKNYFERRRLSHELYRRALDILNGEKPNYRDVNEIIAVVRANGYPEEQRFLDLIPQIPQELQPIRYDYSQGKESAIAVLDRHYGHIVHRLFGSMNPNEFLSTLADIESGNLTAEYGFLSTGLVGNANSNAEYMPIEDIMTVIKDNFSPERNAEILSGIIQGRIERWINISQPESDITADNLSSRLLAAKAQMDADPDIRFDDTDPDFVLDLKAYAAGIGEAKRRGEERKDRYRVNHNYQTIVRAMTGLVAIDLGQSSEIGNFLVNVLKNSLELYKGIEFEEMIHRELMPQDRATMAGMSIHVRDRRELSEERERVGMLLNLTVEVIAAANRTNQNNIGSVRENRDVIDTLDQIVPTSDFFSATDALSEIKRDLGNVDYGVELTRRELAGVS